MLAVAMLFLPSAVLSFMPGNESHFLAALVLPFLTVLVGMGMKRKVLLFGGMAGFVLEILGKFLQFLVERDLSLATWGMMVGGLMILLAAAFELRRAGRIRSQLAAIQAGAGTYIATLD